MNIIFFDGVCNLCSSIVQFIIKHDKHQQFRFASLQSGAAQRLLPADLLHTASGTFILLENDKIYMRSAAALRVSKRLNGLWPLLYAAIAVPPFLRNAAYDFIAKRRYRWFGKKEVCWVPADSTRKLFID